MYPAVVPYLAPWYESVAAQTDRDFDLWISVDGMAVDDAAAAMRAHPRAIWMHAPRGASPSAIRQLAIERMASAYDAIIFVDSDDVMHPSRVAAARRMLRDAEVAACALRIIDGEGRDLGHTFGPEGALDVDTLLPRYNVFGLSNSAYRSALLRRCLPIPPSCVASDWLLATRAWALGAALAFDATPRMSYRQHGANTARVLLPFAARDVRAATACVVDHYRYLLESGWTLPVPVRRALCAARERVERFRRAIIAREATLAAYVDALNALTPRYVWWWCVAHPELEAIWTH